MIINKHNNLHFDDEDVIHITSKEIYEESGGKWPQFGFGFANHQQYLWYLVLHAYIFKLETLR